MTQHNVKTHDKHVISFQKLGSISVEETKLNAIDSIIFFWVLFTIPLIDRHVYIDMKKSIRSESAQAVFYSI